MRIASCLALICALFAAAYAADWPSFRGPYADGISPETGINKDWAARPPQKLWSVPMTDNGYAGPSVAAGKVFIIDHQGNQDIIRAMKLATGEPVWTYKYQDAGNHNYGYTQSTPVYDNGKIYTLSCMGKVHCLNADTGDVIWSADLVAQYGARLPGWRLAMSPVIDEEKVILCTGSANGAVLALNKNTGVKIWQAGGNDQPGYSTPIVATIQGVKQYVVFSATSLNGVEAATGKLLWTYPWRTAHDVNAAMPLIGQNYIFITSNYNRGCTLLEITPKGPVALWENTNMHSHFSSPVAYGNLIYGTSDPNRVVCLDPWNKGNLRWEQKGFGGKGGIVAVDGVLLVLDGGNGQLAMVEINPQAYKELGRFRPLGGESWTTPIVSDGKLIIRNKTTLACFDLK